MHIELLEKLKAWRRETAQKAGVETYRVLSNAALSEIARMRPGTKAELLAIKGVKEKKFAQYGAAILALVGEGPSQANGAAEGAQMEEKKPYAVGAYLRFLNGQLRKFPARVQGEVSSVDIRDRYLFFSLKDKDDESVLPCFMWRTDYEICGVALEIGMEVVAEGCPEVYLPAGRLNLRAGTIELVGEGALKKAYDALRVKLEHEGLFASERKKPLPAFPRRIGVITSETGAVINDFLNNLGKYGFHILFMHSRVEGQAAVQSLLAALSYFEQNQDIDVLVLIRGGGSLESLQAFNNETLVRKIAAFAVPVVCGIGHDKDAPLASLASDRAESTPTAVAILLNRPWERVVQEIQASETVLVYAYRMALDAGARRVEQFSGDIMRRFRDVLSAFAQMRAQLWQQLSAIRYALRDARHVRAAYAAALRERFGRMLEQTGKIIDDARVRLTAADPVRQLRLGYSIAYAAGKVVKHVEQVKAGQELDVRVADGTITATVGKKSEM